MSLRQRIYKAINDTPHDEDQYTSFDGCQSYSTYSGLADQVEEELDNEGINNPTDNQIYEMVGDCIN